MAKEAEIEIQKLKKELERYQREIDRLLKERSEYLRISAHQMKSPLATISFNIDTLLGEYAGRLSSKQLRILESIKRNTDAIQTLIRDILELEKLKTGKVELEEVNYTDICLDVIEELRDKVSEKDIYFEVNIPNKDLIVMGNKFALRQMVINLLENAIKYTNKNGVVSFTVGYDVDDKKVTTIVKDTGIGIPPEDQKKIFEEFYRAPNARKYDRSGTGFGMTIIKHVVDFHGGDIKLWSEVGKGTRITVILPLKEAREGRIGGIEERKKRKRIVVIGGVAAGPKAASRARRLDPDAEITLFEKGYFLAYAGCALPYYISGKLKNQRELTSALTGFEGATEYFRSVKGIEIKNLCEVKKIDREAKTVHYYDLITDRTFNIPYDVLVLATGSSPIIPNIDGIGLGNIFTMRGMESTEQIKNVLADEDIREILILGGGLIGIEIAEALTVSGARVTIVEKENQILPFLDPEMAALVEKHMEQKGVRIIKNETVLSFIGGKKVEYARLRKYKLPADLVIIAVGIKPNIELAEKIGLKIGKTGAIAVNEYMQTSDPDIYAAGDCCETVHVVTKKPYYLPLGSIANKQGRVVGTNIAGGKQVFPPVAGTVIIRVFDFNIAKTGLSEREAIENGFEPICCYVPEYDREHFIPGAEIINIKLIADRKSRQILGAQIIGRGDVAKRVDVTATILYKQGTVDDMTGLDLGYAPVYSNALGALIVASNVLQNKLEGKFKGIKAEEVYRLLNSESNNYIFLDVRTPQEYEEERIPGFDLIPLERLRQRIDEIARDKKIILACESGKRSYQASLILKANHFTDVYVLEGGLRMWPYRLTHE